MYRITYIELRKIFFDVTEEGRCVASYLEHGTGKDECHERIIRKYTRTRREIMQTVHTRYATGEV